MQTNHNSWTIKKLLEHYDQIEFPEFQREPTIWDLNKKQKLIDSIMRDFDISTIYLCKKEFGHDCIDGRQRINAIFSFLGINGKDLEDNDFHLRIENEIYNDRGIFDDINNKRFHQFSKKRKEKFLNYGLNIIEISKADPDEELNLLFLRLQIASVLNVGEKLNAMVGDMRDWIFYDLVKHAYFSKNKIVKRRFAKEQVAAQITLNTFSKQYNGSFQRSRYIDLQDFFKNYTSFSVKDRKLTKEINNTLNKLVKDFGKNLKYIRNRAVAVSVFLFVDELIKNEKVNEIPDFVKFFVLFSRTLKWQIPKNVKMDKAYHNLLGFQTYISQAAGEKTAIENRHDFLREYFYYYRNENCIKGDKEYGGFNKANAKRRRIKL